eukprot:3588424-Pleurochrysis_carterae.AAC.1
MASCSGVTVEVAHLDNHLALIRAVPAVPLRHAGVQGAQLQQHHFVWHVEEAINLGVVRAVPVVALVHIGD